MKGRGWCMFLYVAELKFERASLVTVSVSNKRVSPLLECCVSFF